MCEMESREVSSQVAARTLSVAAVLRWALLTRWTVGVVLTVLAASACGIRVHAFPSPSLSPVPLPAATASQSTGTTVSSSASQPPGWLPYVVAFGPYVGLVVAIIGGVVLIRRGRLDARNAFAAEVLKFRLQQIEEFYAPASLDIEQSRIVYQKLLWMLEKNRALDLKQFRLLDHIHSISTDQEWAEYKPLVDKILEIGEHLTKLVTEHAGLIESGITDTFVQYEAHFNILKAASKQKLSDVDLDGSHEFGYYPRMLNREVREGYKFVLEHLRRYTDAGDHIIADLTHDKTFKERQSLARHRASTLETLHYYEQHAREYADEFDEFDLSRFRERLLNEIEAKKPEGELRLLDAGSGTGRDLLAFIKAGCAVVGIDASPAMNRECRRKIRKARDEGEPAAFKSDCLEMSFDEMRFRNEFDGAWAAASLLHVPKFQTLDILRRLMRALKPGGVCYVSLKYGTGEGERDGRFFYYYDFSALRGLLRRTGSAEEIAIWLSKPDGSDLNGWERLWTTVLAWSRCYDRSLWINVLARHKSG